MGVLDRRFLFCLVLLVVNDQVFKGTFGNWVTGKLSDFAGVVVLSVVIGQALVWLGIARRRARIAGVSFSSAVLVSVKVNAGAAGLVEATAATLGVEYQIVVDRTDLLALVMVPLALSIMREPKAVLDGDLAKRASFIVACVACAASGVDGSAAYDFVERTDEGTIVVGRRAWDGEHSDVKAVLETASPTRWETFPDVDQVDWSLTRQSCSPVDPVVCIELGPGSRIAVSKDAGETYDVAWEVDDGGSWLPAPNDTEVVGRPAFYQATDVAWTDNGRAFIAMSDRYPIVRNTDGSFTPSIADLHPYPWPTLVFLLVGWLVAAAGLRLASERQAGRGGIAFGLAAGSLMLGAGLFGSTFGGVVAILLAPVSLVFLIVALVLAFKGKPVAPPRYRFVEAPIAKLVWPFPVFVMLGYLWDIDVVPWVVMLIAMFAVVLGATKSAWPARQHVQPQPPES